jgi:hypothetical protein
MHTYLVPHTVYAQTASLVARLRMVDPTLQPLGFTPEGHGYAVKMAAPLAPRQRIRLGVRPLK